MKDLAPIIVASITSAAMTFPVSLLPVSNVIALVGETLVFFGSYLLIARVFRMDGLSECISIAKGIRKRTSRGRKDDSL